MSASSQEKEIDCNAQLSPRTNIDPLGHLSKSDFKSKPNALKNASAFYDLYDTIDHVTPSEQAGGKSQTIFVKKKEQPGGQIDCVKIYDTNGSSNAFNKYYEEYKIVKELKLANYKDIFYNDETKQVYIQQPLYRKNLAKQIAENAHLFSSEYAVKMVIGDILDKIWMIHNCGYVHGDIRPQNIARSEEDDGWVLTNFCLKRYKSKGEYVGSAGWSAPEICIDSKKNKFKYSSDIFSLGLLILFCLFGEQPLQISSDERRKYGQSERLWSDGNDEIENDRKLEAERREKQFREDLESKMIRKWYYENLLVSENRIRNYLVKLYYDEKISLALFKLLNDGMLVYNEENRWSCQQIYDCEWFEDVRTQHKRKKVKKLRISIV